MYAALHLLATLIRNIKNRGPVLVATFVPMAMALIIVSRPDPPVHQWIILGLGMIGTALAMCMLYKHRRKVFDILK